MPAESCILSAHVPCSAPWIPDSNLGASTHKRPPPFLNPPRRRRAAQEYKLVSDTLFLAVSYLDRYLSTHRVLRSRLQLVGVTCLLLAAKYEEIYAPNIEEFCYITDNTYSRGDVRASASHPDPATSLFRYPGTG